ncbi:DMT family transporter [Blastochloris sulfoviridis]|uniref:Guanidinium exporter n=1 Tax=Blastochloris sulfoviridis TaxID=50712 RepID=A0A5M6I488_9HYPH|nr:multidrug efflux SMR transporter [Blastochloris sulfoviridis]KAA5602677.1 multidrug efflux SMR transporter [Blastochloris sulfoviridis]
MAWLTLLLAGLLEIVWAYAMKLSEGFTRPLPTAITITALIASLVLLSLATKVLPLGTAYAVWTGIGAVGAFAIGIVFLGEPLTALHLVAAALIVCGIALMKLASGD